MADGWHTYLVLTHNFGSCSRGEFRNVAAHLEWSTDNTFRMTFIIRLFNRYEKIRICVRKPREFRSSKIKNRTKY